MSKYKDRSELPTELKRVIFCSKDSYVVKNDRNMVMLTFGKFRSLDVACAAALLMIKYDWNIKRVNGDSIYEFNNKFYVFNVMDNQLIFDSEWDSFESAVEKLEINARCNDYHNDIFKGSINKNNDYKDKYVESEPENEVETDTKHIFQRNDKFIVKKSKRRDSQVFGEFNSFEEAMAAQKMLKNFKWRLSDGTEITFFDNYYWVFEIKEDIIYYLGKTESYEDTFDIINPFKAEEKPKDDLDSRIEEYLRKKEQNKKIKKSIVKGNKQQSPKKKIKERISPRSTKIWKPLIKKNKIKTAHYNFIIINSTGKMDKLVAIFDFDIVGDNIICKVDGVKIPWERRFDLKLGLFPEFELFIRIFENNYFDISKINKSSSIYYFDKLYYKIRVISKDSIIFNAFKTYSDAEKSKLIYKRMSLRDYYTPDINYVFGNYELVKIKEGSVLKIRPLKSLEMIKAIRDILIHLSWNINELKRYDLFYLNGLYWELEYFNHEIILVNKYESVKIV